MDLDDLFLFEARRRVNNDRTVSLNGTIYEVEPHLIRATVRLRYDPQAPKGRPVQVWLDAKRQADATVVDAYQNCFVRRQQSDHQRIEASAPPPAPPRGLRLSTLADSKEVS